MALRFAALDAPMEAISGVEQVPMFWPRMMGMALPQVTTPVLESACRMPTLALLDWMATVTSVPASTPSTGFCSWVNSWTKRGLSFRGATAFSMVNRPVNRMPKPMQIWPMLRFLGLFKNTNSTAPTKATMGRRCWA